ncbi:magnesium and cobalt transport protein CorA [Candidatus Koribacter versatilis Ellin345]|uniref:Magnesium transport protein CorA n=1 Tax=Koribacter versatilis (strain Ellin345) TaxID=204669 RepID=Q1IPH5_KORVE|nr:magnesium/cobalt transporter CorA [Candidatus Koribacter versatilis]ABF41225.1 magnesium and cobalt transport protein CorA [Candidatus Koribacter versatilis Ellin345]
MNPIFPHLAWYDISDPASPELDELARRFHLHELQIEDCRHRPQRPKAEEHDHYIFTVLKHIHPHDELTFDDVDVFLGKDFLITVRNEDAPFFEHVRARAEQEKVDRLDRLFYFIVDRVVDGYQPELDKLDDQISEIEDVVLDHPSPEILSNIFSLKRNLVEFRRVASGMREVVLALTRREKGLLGDDLDPYFRDIYDHIIRTVDMVETYRDLLSGALDIYLSAVANRTNEVMKVLTIWGTIALPLVIITGFFGMNLKLPWQNDPHGTWYAVALMAISTVGILIYFKMKKWF